MVRGGSTDTDKDGLTDSEEVDWNCIDVIMNGKEYTSEDGTVIALPTFEQVLGFSNFYDSETYDRISPYYRNAIGNINLLPIKSDPTSVDGDGDGYYDCIKNLPNNQELFVDKKPLKNDIVITEIPNTDYLPVLYNGIEYNDDTEGYYSTKSNYGGNQMWFYNKSNQIPDSQKDPIGYELFLENLKGQDKIDYEFEHQGCGITATVDLLSYISLYKNGYDDITNFGNKGLPVSYNDYDKFARSIAGIYIKPASNGFQIVNGFNKYMEDNSKDCFIKYLSMFYSPKYITLEFIKKNLISDKPVMMSVFVASPDKKSISETNRVCLYERSNNTFKNPKSAVGQHYMNITGVIKDTNIEKTFLQVSTWGKKRYVDIDEFYKKCADFHPINSVGSGFYFTVN